MNRKFFTNPAENNPAFSIFHGDITNNDPYVEKVHCYIDGLVPAYINTWEYLGKADTRYELGYQETREAEVYEPDITSRCFGSKRCVFMQNNQIKTNTENLLFYPDIYSNKYPKISANAQNLVDIFTAWKGVEDYDDRIIISHIDP